MKEPETRDGINRKATFDTTRKTILYSLPQQGETFVRTLVEQDLAALADSISERGALKTP